MIFLHAYLYVHYGHAYAYKAYEYIWKLANSRSKGHQLCCTVGGETLLFDAVVMNGLIIQWLDYLTADRV